MELSRVVESRNEKVQWTEVEKGFVVRHYNELRWRYA